jgi:group I intron endonuclease
MTQRKTATHDNDGAGTYLIRCVANGKVYVGSSGVSVMSRKQHHFQLLRRGSHRCTQMQEDFNAYGSEAFQFEVVQLLSDGTNFEAERRLIELHDATNAQKGYNTVKVPIETPGRPRIADEDKSAVYSFSIYEEHDQKVNRIMRETGMNRSAVFRMIIEDGYKEMVAKGIIEGGSAAD